MSFFLDCIVPRCPGRLWSLNANFARHSVHGKMLGIWSSFTCKSMRWACLAGPDVTKYFTNSSHLVHTPHYKFFLLKEMFVILCAEQISVNKWGEAPYLMFISSVFKKMRGKKFYLLLWTMESFWGFSSTVEMFFILYSKFFKTSDTRQVS